MSSDLLDLEPLTQRAADLVAAAQKAGADGADAVAARALSRQAEVRNGALEEMEHAESDVLGLRVFVGKRSAIVSTGEGDGGDWAALAQRAVAMANAAPEDAYAGLADAGDTGIAADDLDLLDGDMPQLPALTETARACEDALLGIDGVTKSGGASASYGLSGVVLVTSAGFSGGYLRSRRTLFASAIAGEGTGMQRDYGYHMTLHGEDLDSAEEIGRLAGERAVVRLNPDKMPTGTGTVVFSPRVAWGLMNNFASAVNGAAIARGTSMLKDKMDAQVFARGITIDDDPLRRRGLASRPFDGDGLAARPLTLVEDGVLQTWLLDCATARELGLASTAHAVRGAGSPPSPGSSNLTLRPGPQSPEELIASIDDGVYVTELIGRGANTITGDYSRGAAGFRIEGGKQTVPVAEITIAGNLHDMFARLVPANDLTYRYTANAPTVAIEGMTIAGR